MGCTARRTRPRRSDRLSSLLLLDAAETVEDLRVPPGNRLEKLHGDRARQHSIRINQQWRICFRWTPAGPEDVEIVEHRGGSGMGVTGEATVMAPIHPGEILAEEYLGPLGVTQHRLALAVGVPPRRINEVVHGKRRISADTALRLARFFGTSDRFWINLQSRYDLEVERERLASTLAEIRPLSA